MKILLLCAVLSALSLSAQVAAKIDPKVSATTTSAPKPTPITDSGEKIRIYDIFADGQKLQEKMLAVQNDIATTQLGKERADLINQANTLQAKINSLNAKIVETPLGKEIGELQVQATELQKKFDEMSRPIVEAHNCPGGSIKATLELTGCPAAVPVQAVEAKK